MNFLIIGINFHPELTGIGKYTGEMAAWLAKQEHAVRVVTAPPYYPWWRVQPPYRGGQYRRERWQGVEIWRSPLWVPKQVSGWKRLLHLASFALFSAPLILMNVFWHPDVVLVVAPAISAAPFGWLVARLSGAKAWLHFQDFEIDAALNLGILPAEGFVANLLRLFEQRLLRGFDVLSTISHRMCERLQAKGVPRSRILFFPNWVDTKVIYPLNGRSNPLRHELGLAETDTVVLYSGNMGEKQGLEILIEAARFSQRIDSLHFVLCGEGAVKVHLQALAADLKNVHFLPLQPMERLNTLLNLADIHVLPQRADAADLVMPSKLTGMLASGKVVIATAHPETELGSVVQEVGVLVPPGDSRALANAIQTLKENTACRTSLGARGRRYAEAHYDRQHVLKNIHEHLMALDGA